MAKILQDISIGQNLRRIRDACDLTQQEVCARLSILGRPMSQPNYALIETGVRNIFVSDLIALKSVLETSYEELFDGLTPVNRYEAEAEKYR